MIVALARVVMLVIRLRLSLRSRADRCSGREYMLESEGQWQWRQTERQTYAWQLSLTG